MSEVKRKYTRKKKQEVVITEPLDELPEELPEEPGKDAVDISDDLSESDRDLFEPATIVPKVDIKSIKSPCDCTYRFGSASCDSCVKYKDMLDGLG